MSRARLRENASTSTLPIFIGSWDGARKGRSSLMAEPSAAGLQKRPFAQTLLRRHGLRQSAAQGIFMGSPRRPLERSKARRGPPAVLVSTYYDAILIPRMSSQPIFITY